MITKDTEDMYHELVQELYSNQQARNSVVIHTNDQLDVERRVASKVSKLKYAYGKDKMWDEMFEEYKSTAKLSDEDIWKEVGHYYSSTHPVDEMTKK